MHSQDALPLLLDPEILPGSSMHNQDAVWMLDEPDRLASEAEILASEALIEGCTLARECDAADRLAEILANETEPDFRLAEILANDADALDELEPGTPRQYHGSL